MRIFLILVFLIFSFNCLAQLNRYRTFTNTQNVAEENTIDLGVSIVNDVPGKAYRYLKQDRFSGGDMATDDVGLTCGHSFHFQTDRIEKLNGVKFVFVYGRELYSKQPNPDIKSNTSEMSGHEYRKTNLQKYFLPDTRYILQNNFINNYASVYIYLPLKFKEKKNLEADIIASVTRGWNSMNKHYEVQDLYHGALGAAPVPIVIEDNEMSDVNVIQRYWQLSGGGQIEASDDRQKNCVRFTALAGVGDTSIQELFTNLDMFSNFYIGAEKKWKVQLGTGMNLYLSSDNFSRDRKASAVSPHAWFQVATPVMKLHLDMSYSFGETGDFYTDGDPEDKGKDVIANVTLSFPLVRTNRKCSIGKNAK